MLATAPAVATRRFRAMGGAVHAVVVGAAPGAADAVEARLADLEARWSRFRADSELCRLNAAAGRPVVVSRDTFHAIERAVAAWDATGGRFDPTVLPALVALGYDDDLAVVQARADHSERPARRAPGCAGIHLDATVGAVTLPVGTAIDLGGIGKGLAADLVVDELLTAGAAGACVNVGGDLRVQGASPERGGWTIGVHGAPGIRLGLAAGGVATSSATRRRWSSGGTFRHHLVDPGTGRSAFCRWRAVTVVAGTAAAAEVLTKAAWVAGPQTGADTVTSAGATGLVVTDAGTGRARRARGVSPVTEPVWWHVARAGGLVAWVLATVSVVWGLWLSGRLAKKPKPAWTLDLHRFLGALTLVFAAVHVVALWADSFVYFGPVELFVPLTSSWNPMATAWGIVAWYVLLAVEVTSLAMRKLPRSVWRAVHLSSFGLFALATVHALTAGSDADHPLVVGFAMVSTALVVNLAALRVVSRRVGRAPARGRAGAPTRSVAARP